MKVEAPLEAQREASGEAAGSMEAKREAVANAWAASRLGSGGLEGGEDEDLGSNVEHQTRQQDVRNSGCGL